MRRKGQICVLFDEVPPNTTYREGAYSWVQLNTGLEYIKKGYGEEYDPVSKETEEIPEAEGDGFPDDFPESIKAICLEDKRQWDEVEELYKDGNLQDITGVGDSTEQKIKNYFE
jgi:hypothetical protein